MTVLALGYAWIDEVLPSFDSEATWKIVLCVLACIVLFPAALAVGIVLRVAR